MKCFGEGVGNAMARFLCLFLGWTLRIFVIIQLTFRGLECFGESVGNAKARFLYLFWGWILRIFVIILCFLFSTIECLGGCYLRTSSFLVFFFFKKLLLFHRQLLLGWLKRWALSLEKKLVIQSDLKILQTQWDLYFFQDQSL